MTDRSETSVDPRVERSRRVILDAALDELGEVGYGSFSIEAVARRAGVGKATIYRHWDGKLDLVGDAITMLKQSSTPPDTEDVRDRIEGLLRSIAELLASSRMARCLPAIIDAAERDPEVRAFHHTTSARRRVVMVGLLEEAARQGRLSTSADPTILAEALVAPMFLRRLMSDEPFPPDGVPALVETVLGPHWVEG